MKRKSCVAGKLFFVLLCISLMAVCVFALTVAAEETASVTVRFNTNGGAELYPVTVTLGEKYGRLPSSAVTGLSGGDSNWYLVDQNGDVTDTKITRLTYVTLENDHTLFIKRKVLAPTLKITLQVPGAISDGYQYYVPGNSQRILTVTVNNQNTDVLGYTYQWYKDGTAIENATESVLALDGNVADSGTYKVKVTATLKDGTGIEVTENTASAEKEQKVKILHAANTLYYDANGGEGGPSSNYTGGAAITVSGNQPTREGYIFDGWNTKADGTGEDCAGGATFTFEQDNGNGGCSITLYAKWIKLYDIYVGGMQVTDKNNTDVFGDGCVSYDPQTNTLFLRDYSYKGEGYVYGGSDDGTEKYSAVIYSKNSLNIDLKGSNTLENTFNDGSLQQYGDGVVTDGSIVFAGDGYLSIMGSYGIYAGGDLIIDGCTVNAETADAALCSENGSVKISNASLYIVSGADGIYAHGDITVADSELNIAADTDGVYSYDGSVEISCTKVSPASHGPWLEGTRVTIEAKGKYGIFAYKGLKIDKKLMISTPENGIIGELSERDYTYSTVLSGETVAKDIVIEPKGYKVFIKGLSYDMSVLVPAFCSANEIYCEIYGIEDFSEMLNTEKEGFVFGGLYTDEACSEGNEFSFDISLTADVTIYAKWTAETPQTGDNSVVWIWCALASVSGIAAVTVISENRKRRV